ncbi:uncharacterized protein LOC121415051 isoform X1 [Lytechinus variegatus]|uniref:uncharacterized protein LOC121415051 isoform X1 n=1 Tax=Lytechinus variegatus TaxID=7654 RepID=UPI001BB28FC0|nr:uncharacterized protein LOC121415051 isoform X1 [Lytechinus variegatus]
METQSDATKATDAAEVVEPRLQQSPDVAPSRHGKKPSRVDLPGKTYAELIAMAIKSSPSRMMTIVEIQRFFQENFSCFRTSYRGWHNSIRHNLSARECFYKVPILDKSQKCRVHFWMLNPNCSHCRDGNGLLEEARQWRNRRMMAKQTTRKQRRGSKKNGSSTTRNADGLNSIIEVENGNARLPYQPFPSTTPPVHPIEINTTGQSCHSPHQAPLHYESGLEYHDYPFTYHNPTQPSCLKCGDETTGDCEYCVLLEVDEEDEPTPMRHSSSPSSSADFLTKRIVSEMTSQARPHSRLFRLSVKEEPNEWDLQDGSVLDDFVDRRDLLPTDDNFDASAYDVEGQMTAPLHSRPTSTHTTLSPSTVPPLTPSSSPTSPVQYPLDLSCQGSFGSNGHTQPQSKPNNPRYHAYHPNLVFTAASSVHSNGKRTFHEQGYPSAQCSRQLKDSYCYGDDRLGGVFRYPSGDVVSDGDQIRDDGRTSKLTEFTVIHGQEFIHRSKNDRQPTQDLNQLASLRTNFQGQWTPPPSPFAMGSPPDTHQTSRCPGGLHAPFAHSPQHSSLM